MPDDLPHEQQDKSRKRAIRRHHRARLKKYRVSHYGGPGHRSDHDRWLGRLVNTATQCSCWMCGNPRRYFQELTLQERRVLAGIRAGEGEESAEVD